MPYRNSLHTGTYCDAQLVASTLRRDFEQHGAPPILRFDRASAHGAPEVRDLLDAYEVLPLHVRRAIRARDARGSQLFSKSLKSEIYRFEFFRPTNSFPLLDSHG